ncbi:MAG: pyridoxal phosphate-dependent aminotransferase [Candidatus Adiutrix sp.]|nr:pyridoxal phosphate-dependent aminotransferase [Candidatus Adiutrix sp.]
MLISKKMAALAAGDATIRRMFEEGRQMKAALGAENVFDFSIGNPDVPPPPAFHEALTKVVAENSPGLHNYLPNSGWPVVRAKIAEYLIATMGDGLANPFGPEHIVMTCGAGGALNLAFKTLLDPGDEVITPRPYFMEYGNYVDNHSGRLVSAEPGPDFRLNVPAIAVAITPATRAVLINSPHNPTGVIYTAEELAALGAALKEASARFGRPILLVADEPYRKLAYGGRTVPPVFPHYAYAVAATSYSKDLSLPGERLGYAAINPDMPEADRADLFDALNTANRILGYVGGPALMQRVVAELQGVSVDVSLYERRRDLMVEGLRSAGYTLTVPDGAFYLFPQSPLADDQAFVAKLKEERILAAPGVLFEQPGYFRLCYCADESSIKNALPGFARALAACA